LNSDALVPPGWFATMTARLADPLVGAVVPAYMYPDGSLQEAGAVVEADGRVVALGVDTDPDDERWMFARRVPYGSAACMLIRRETYAAVGGFDPVWGLAYYEDVDLAFRVRELGQSVTYEPAVRVVHAQGASAEPHPEALARRDANQARFRARWIDRLWHRPTLLGATQAHRFAAARDEESVDRVLVIAPSAGPPERAAELARALTRALDAGQVTLAVPRRAAAPTLAPELGAAGVEVVVPDDWDGWLSGRQFHFSAVIADDPERSELAPSFERTQPQAAVSASPSAARLQPSELAGWLLDMALVPRQEARRYRRPSPARQKGPAS
jgi:hypothetical protein